MNEQFVREVLDEQADREMPVLSAQSLWPGIRERIQTGERTGEISRSAGSQQIRMSRMAPSLPRLKPFVIAGVAAVVAIAVMLALGPLGTPLGTVAWFAQPAPANAAEILARSEQVANAPAVKSFHGVWSSRLRNKATEAFFTPHSESWYLAPSSYRSEGRTVEQDGREETSLIVQDGTMIWLYLSEYHEVILKDRDASIPVFGDSNLQSLTGRGWLKDYFEPELVGTDVVLGRRAYVLEFTLKPQDQWPPNHRIGNQTARMKYWVDQQAYFTLKFIGWDAKGNELMVGGFTSLQIDASIDPSRFSFAPPAGAQVLDTRTASADELNALWKQTAQQAPFNVYRPTKLLGEREGRPYFDPAQGEFTQALPEASPRTANSFEVQMPVITQRRASNKGLQGSGQSVKVGSLTGLYVRNKSEQTLTIVRDGTEITLSLPVVHGGINMTENMVYIAESLELVQK